MADEMEMIEPSGIPHFIGDLDALATDVMLLAADAGQLRASGSDVHTTFQHLSAFYSAPEAEQLFATTLPVQQKSDAFADDLEKVAGALLDYSIEVEPLVKRLDTLKAEATAFVNSVAGDDDWKKDQGKIDHNLELWQGVNHTVTAFQAAERRAYDKIMALIGGELLTVDDGSHGKNMYGYKADDLDHAEETPWGAPAEREYEGWAWVRHTLKSAVWDGFIVDGVWGTIKGLGTLVGTDGWDAAGDAWTNLGKLGTGLVITLIPVAGEAFWMASDDKLPSWLRDSRTAMKETGKALVAYDTWKTNPARATGAVAFNGLTAVFTGGSGAAAASGASKASAAVRTVSAVSKFSRAVDPMTYIGKAGKFTFTKVGDTFTTLKNLHTGTTADLLKQAEALRSPTIPDTAIPYLDTTGKVVYLTDEGHVLNPDGSLRQHADQAAAEVSAADRSRIDAAPHSPAEVRTHERKPQLVGAHAATNSAADEVGSGRNTSAGGGAGHSPSGGHRSEGSPAASHSTADNAASHGTSGSGSHSQQASHSSSNSSTSSHDADGSHHEGSSSSPAQGGGNPAPSPVGDGYVQQTPHRTSGSHSSLDPETVDNRIAELDDRLGGEGHAPGRHLYPSDDALRDRLGTVAHDAQGNPRVYGPNSNYPGLFKSENNIDPLTGTTVDGVSGRAHRVGAFATRFDNAEDMVTADRYFRDEIARTGEFPQTASIEQVLGPEGYKRLSGFYRDPANPRESLPVDFQGGSIIPVYRFENGNWRLHTMFADPATGRHP
ncbi:hypothetical protein NGF19_03925 [Streptomyces sp. RY43-2]|uniref:Uncharacterized protein n=1 Tax=Streptomyces macrolidinus TaxID=2952607 RepID=A0ABT0Z858_9ACTN|nr:hypothetical protein [Streptomyces macrolidinus]MCN9239943.1 hypothetical protein [Streptomyces macrolidinus]